MPKEESIVDTKLKHKGVFDLELIYNKLMKWLINEGYSDPVRSGEKKYAEKVKPNGKQVEILWESSKEEEGGFFLVKIKVSFYVTGLNEAEVESNGKMIKLDRASIEMRFSSSVTTNAKGEWDETSFFYKIYKKYIVRDKIEEIKIECYKDTNDLISEVKSFLSLYNA